MQCKFIDKNDNRRLIVILAGWAMDSTPFEGLHRHGYDIMVVWDYRDFILDWNCTAPYDEICIVAWSLGVYAAAAASAPIAARVTLRLAVNGTLAPVDALRGIPPAIFQGTLDGLDERNLVKFYRRVAGSREAYARFAAAMPRRDISELKAELEEFLPRDFFLLLCSTAASTVPSSAVMMPFSRPQTNGVHGRIRLGYWSMERICRIFRLYSTASCSTRI